MGNRADGPIAKKAGGPASRIVSGTSVVAVPGAGAGTRERIPSISR